MVASRTPSPICAKRRQGSRANPGHRGFMVAMPGASGSCLVTSPIRVAVSHGKQSLEELPIASEGDPKVLGGGFFATVPLLFEPRTCLGEANRQLLNDIRRPDRLPSGRTLSGRLRTRPGHRPNARGVPRADHRRKASPQAMIRPYPVRCPPPRPPIRCFRSTTQCVQSAPRQVG